MIYKNTLKVYFAVYCAVAALLLLSFSTRNGVGVGGDATIYMTSAQNLIEGRGLGLLRPDGEFRLIPYFPPFYSLVLAAFGKLGMNMTSAAGLINALCFAVMVFFITKWMVQKNKSLFPGLFFGVLLSGSPILIPAFSWGMSEPLALMTGFLSLMLAEKYIEEKNPFALIAAGILAGLSFLTRYASVAFVVAGLIVLFCFANKPFFKRLLSCVIFALLALIPMVIWLIIDMKQTQTIASRSLLEGWLTQEILLFLSKLPNVFAVWFFPESWLLNGKIPAFLPSILAAAILFFPFFCLIFGCLFAKKEQLSHFQKRACRMLVIQSVFFICYMLVIGIVAVTTFPPITINSRMLLPAYVSFFWMVFLLLGLFLDNNLKNWLRVITLILFGIFSVYSLIRGARISQQNAIDGIGYNQAKWRESDLIDYLTKNEDIDQVIVTNEETALLYLSGRASWPIHEIYVSMPDAEYYAYGDESIGEFDAGRKAFIAGDALLVLFDTFEDQMAEIYGTDAASRIEALLDGLKVVYQGTDGTIYSMH